MKRIILLIMFITSISILVEAKFLKSEELNAVDRALEMINCTRSDLNYEKKWGGDKFLLEPVEKSLNEPLELPEISFQLKQNLTSSIDSAITEAKGILKLRSKNPKLRKQKKLNTNSSDLLIKDLKILIENAEIVIDSFDLTQQDKEEYYNSFIGKVENNQETVTRLEQLNLDDLFEVCLSFYPGLGRLTSEELAKLPYAEFLAKDEGILIVINREKDEAYDIGGYPYQIIIDSSGNDEYKFIDNPLKNSLHIIIDTSGNDKYIGSEKRGPGSGFMGIGIVIDLEGNDTYEGNDFCFGTAIGGIGILIDEEGDDKYSANDFCMGAGYFGLGLLFDYSGDDTFESSRYSQGFASTKGIGVLSDRKGNDSYITGRKVLHEPLYNDHYQSLSQGFSIGMRSEGFAGGVGLLHDGSGNDKYIGDVYSQGAGYWYALGILFDEDGEDTYSAWIYGQGSGIHLAAGCLIDLNGDDSYTLNDGVGQGGGHDLAIGFLIDRNGNDNYSGSGITQGGGHANGIGILIDYSGDDSYSGVKDIVQGWGTGDRGSCSLGILIDLDGTDKYSNQGQDNFIWYGHKYGVGIDEQR